MSINKMLELMILQEIFDSFNNDVEYNKFLSNNYDVEKINDRYLELGKEFLDEYALNKTEKSEENLLQLNTIIYAVLNIDNELAILERYKLTPTELFTVRVILLAKEDGNYEYLKRYNSLLDGGFRLELEKLQNKGIILKSYKIPAVGQPFLPENVEFNKNFTKQIFRTSFEMGEELFNTYPQFLTINGVNYNARRVSKKFDSLEDAFAKYAKNIKYDPEVHQKILDNIKWAIENGNYPFTTLDDFICDRAHTALAAFREGSGTNVNSEAIKMI